MHRLTTVTVRNFRSCREVSMRLDDCTPLVGRNNAGKSNILDAVSWFISSGALGSGDFHDVNESVIVEGVIAGLDDDHLATLGDKHRPKIESYIQEGCLALRRVQPQPGGGKAAIAVEVRDPGEPEGSEAAWKPNPSGIDNALRALFPEPIIIGAMEDAAEDATKAKTSSTIGKLLALFTGPAEASHGVELSEALSPLADKLTAEGAERARELTRFDREATRALEPFFPGIRLHLDIPVPTVRDLFGKGTIKISENGREGIRDFTDLGHGAQRSIQMALIRYLAEVRAESGQSAQRRLLLVEEPELFLHPQAIEKVRRALERLAQHGYQVIFATHSPVMIDRTAIARTRIVREDEATGETRIMASASEALERRIGEANNRLQTLFDLESSSQWLFSDRVLLAEGPTERRILPVLYEAVTGRPPADDGLAIISLGGAGSIPDSLRVFRELGIEARALADFDFAINHAVQHGLIQRDDEGLTACLDQIRATAEQDATIRIGDNGRPIHDKDDPENQQPAAVYKAWAATPDAEPVVRALHERLKARGIWLWTQGAIEDHLGLSGQKTEKSWAPFCRRLEDESWRQVVADPEGVEALMSWFSSGPDDA